MQIEVSRGHRFVVRAADCEGAAAVAAHFDEVYGAMVSKDTISRITDKVIGVNTTSRRST